MSKKKGKVFFYPRNPVPMRFLVGRMHQLRIVIRAVRQVEAGKQQSIFLTTEYGISKNYFLKFVRNYAELNNHLLVIHVFLGGAKTVEDVIVRIVERIIRERINEESKSENIRNFFAKYIGPSESALFGLNINLDKLKADSVNLKQEFLSFLKEFLKSLNDENVKGIMLVLDEFDDLIKNAEFSYFIKNLINENLLSNEPLPLLLMVCAGQEARQEMLKHYKPEERFLDIIEIEPMNADEKKDFLRLIA